MLAVNVEGTLCCGADALRHMLARRTGAIVNVTSGSAAGFTGGALYGAAKAAVLTITRSWAVDAAVRGVRVNAISPLATTAVGDILRSFYVGKNVPGW
jgi:NAD(P)-dependent dehydrogenase (short-subunit alcohol dehydrogenase family)